MIVCVLVHTLRIHSAPNRVSPCGTSMEGSSCPFCIFPREYTSGRSSPVGEGAPWLPPSPLE